jgi:linoleoyl-CoA desaturase
MLWSSAAVRGSAQMYLKTLVLVSGVAMAGIGSNIMRDGGHQAYSKRRWINRLMAMTLDLVGGSS